MISAADVDALGGCAGPVATFGETMGLVRADGIGSLAQAHTASIGIGGSESNVAVGLARLGLGVRWLGRIGDDAFGRRIERELWGERVDARTIRDSVAPTGVMFKDTPLAGRSRVSYRRSGSAGSRIRPDDIDQLDIPSASLLHVTGITAALSTNARETVFAAIEIAAAAGIPVSFDVNYRAQLWSTDKAAPVLRWIAARASIVFAGEQEARILSGLSATSDETAENLARRIADTGPFEVIVTRGARGAVALSYGEATDAPARDVEVVDTVGAGDAFVAGYLAETLASSPTARRLDVAARVAAFVCMHPGDWEGLPRRAELELVDDSEPVIR